MRSGGVLLATHSLHFRVHTRVLLTILVALAATAVMWAEPPHRALMREAGAAQQAGNLPLMLEKLEAIRAMRPDYPRVLTVLARAYTAADRKADALAQLESLAARGISQNIGADQALVALQAEPAFAPLAARLAQNGQPRGDFSVALTLAARDGMIESVARDSRGRWFFGDIRNRCIWVWEADGTIARFSGEHDGLLGVFGLAIDEKRGVLWAGVSAVPQIRNFNATDKGWGYLAEYDLATGAFRRSLQVSTAGREHIFGSLRLAADGSVFVSDSASPVIWRAAPDATQLEAWLEHSDFGSLQGLDFSADGRTLYVADYANGVWAIDVATKTPTLLQPADDTTLFAIDDLHRHGDALIGVQNGFNPVRVVRFQPVLNAPVRAEVLAQAHAAMSDAATGCIADGRYHFVGNSGWALYERPAATEPAPRDVQVLAVKL